MACLVRVNAMNRSNPSASASVALAPASGSRTRLGRVCRAAVDNPRIESPAPRSQLPAHQTGPRGWADRAVDRLLPERNPARLVYGVLAIGAVLAAESGSHENYLDTAGSAVIAIGLYWLAHAYADVLGHRLQAHERLSIAILGRAFRDEAAILLGAVLPLLALLICWMFGVALASGVEAALWTTVVSLIAFELLAGIRARATPRELAFEAAIGATMGLAIIALKVVLH